MATKEYGLKIDETGKMISITGITSSSVMIDYSGDIDFTKLVTELTQAMDSKDLLSPNAGNDTSTDDSLKLILETIDAIIEEYNNAVKSLKEEEDVSLPMPESESSVSSDFEEEEDDDLPF